jgi:DNA-binding FadR family transcriptional regulator
MSERRTEIVAAVRGRIRGGVYLPGARIPSQSEMADEFGIAERMVGFVIAELREQGYLLTLPHKGSYVQPSEHWADIDHEGQV